MKTDRQIRIEELKQELQGLMWEEAEMLWEGVLFMFVPILSGAITFFVLMYLGVFVLDRIGVTAYSRQFATSSKILLVVSGAIASGVVAFLLH